MSTLTEKIKERVGSMLKSVTLPRGVLNTKHRHFPSICNWRLLLILILVGLFMFMVYLPYAVPVGTSRYVGVYQPAELSNYINCQSVITGDEEEHSRAIFFMMSQHRRLVSSETIQSQSKNCSQFKHDKGYILKPVNDEDKEFPLAFSILMYKDVDQVERLLRSIYRPQNYYCIHVDVKAEHHVLHAMATLANCFDNVFILDKFIDVQWGQFSVLEPDLLCMQALLKYKWKYFINLTGQEFPLKTNYQLVKILKTFQGTNNIEAGKRISSDYIIRWIWWGWPPYGASPIKGALHIIASREFVDFTLHDKKAQDVLKWVNKTFIPDETFFSTLNYNSQLGAPGGYKGTIDSLPTTVPYIARYKNWGEFECHGKYVRGICVLGIGDLPKITQGKMLFANKFHYNYQPLAFDCLEQFIANETKKEYDGRFNFDLTFYHQKFMNS